MFVFSGLNFSRVLAISQQSENRFYFWQFAACSCTTFGISFIFSLFKDSRTEQKPLMNSDCKKHSSRTCYYSLVFFLFGFLGARVNGISNHPAHESHSRSNQLSFYHAIDPKCPFFSPHASLASLNGFAPFFSRRLQSCSVNFCYSRNSLFQKNNFSKLLHQRKDEITFLGFNFFFRLYC